MAQTPNAEYQAAQIINLAHNLAQDLQVAQHVLDTYQLSDLQGIVAALASGANVPDTPFDKEGMLAVITAFDLFIKLMNDQPVVQGNWKSGLVTAAALKTLVPEV